MPASIVGFALSLALLAGTFACAPGDASPDRAASITADVAGHYGQGGHIGSLDLAADGTYESFVINGLTADGCGTFAGAGVSRGIWTLVDGQVAFAPTSEPADLVLKFADLAARPAGDGLVVTLGDSQWFLARESVDEVSFELDETRAPHVTR